MNQFAIMIRSTLKHQTIEEQLRGAHAQSAFASAPDLATHLPTPARLRFDAVVAFAEDRRGAQQVAYEAQQAGRQRLRDVETSVNRIRGFGATEGDPKLIAEIEARDRIAAEYERLRDRYQNAREDSSAANRIEQKAREFLRLAPKLVSIEDPLRPLRKGETFLLAVEAEREIVQAKTKQIAALERQPMTEDEAIAAAIARIDEVAHRGRPDVGAILLGKAPQFRDKAGLLIGLDAQTRSPLSEIDGTALVFWLHRDRLVEKLSEEIRAASSGDGIAAADRASAIATARAELRAAERRECALIFAAAREGHTIPFRPETDAASILGCVAVDEFEGLK